MATQAACSTLSDNKKWITRGEESKAYLVVQGSNAGDPRLWIASETTTTTGR
jgi:hypothetical protein